MSFDIIYSRAFIKVDTESTVPVLLIGSSNCYDVSYNRNGKERRSRDWCNISFHTEGSIIGLNKQILDHIDNNRLRVIKRCEKNVIDYNDASWAYNDKGWGYHTGMAFYGKGTSGTTFSAYRSFYANGIKTARTIEEYKQIGISFNVHVYCWDKQKDFTDKGIEYKERVYIDSTEHLIATINEFEGYYKPFKYSVYVTAHISEYTAKKLKKKRVFKDKTAKHLSEVYKLSCLNTWGYFVKQVKLGYQYSNSGKMFETEQQANKFHSRMKNKDQFEVKKVSGSFTIYV